MSSSISKKRLPKKSSFSAAEYLQQVPLDEDIREKDGGKYIPIAALEKSLDFFQWSEKNFVWQFYKDGYGNLCVAASIEIELPVEDETLGIIVRTFVGACNFEISSAPKGYFLATAKSECVKNAASDAGRKFGRGLNEEVIPVAAPVKLETPKAHRPPAAHRRQRGLNAGEEKDETAIAVMSNIYEFKTDQNETE